MTIRKGLCIPLLAVCVAALVWSGGICEEDTLINGVILFLQEDLYNPANNPGLTVVIFGQLTNGGVPVGGSLFLVGVNFLDSAEIGEIWDGSVDLTLMKGEGVKRTFYAIYCLFDSGIEADGAQIHYVLPPTRRVPYPTGILSYNINMEDLSDSYVYYTDPDELLTTLSAGDLEEDISSGVWRFWLPFLPIDPPGEAHVAFF